MTSHEVDVKVIGMTISACNSDYSVDLSNGGGEFSANTAHEHLLRAAPESTTDLSENFEIADEDEDNGSETASDLETVGYMPLTLHECASSKPCLVCTYLILSLLALSSLLTASMVTAVVVLPFDHVSNFVHTTCVALNSTWRPLKRRCSACTGGCSTVFPCLTVYVHVLNVPNLTSTLSEDETSLHRKCSIYPHCKKTPEQINFQLQEYYAQYGKPGTNYSCYVNSDGLAEVIREKRFQFSEVLHGVIWPIAVFVVSTASLVVTFRRRRCGNNT